MSEWVQIGGVRFKYLYTAELTLLLVLHVELFYTAEPTLLLTLLAE